MTSTTGRIIWAGLMPHPPIVVPGVGGGREREAGKTCRAMSELAEAMVALKPVRMILISPHSPRRPGAFGVWGGERLRGSLDRFGAPEEQVDLPADHRFRDALRETAKDHHIRLWMIDLDEELDHGAVVPLCYLTKAGWQGPTTIISLNYPGEGQLEALGKVIAEAADRLDGLTALLASGDMSHRLKPGAPGGYHPKAHLFDERFVELIRSGDYSALRKFPEDLQELAGEDVLDSSLVAVAAVEFKTDNHHVLSYEGPFGVGYCVAQFYSGKEQPPSSGNRDETNHRAQTSRSGAHLPALARQAVETYVREGRVILPPSSPRAEFSFHPSGVFVTIRTRDGELRGCIGTLRPRFQTVEEEVIDRAIASATMDSRFSPVQPEELDDLVYEVSVLHPPEPVDDESQLDPERYGVIITGSGGRSGVMLPRVPTLDTVEKQLRATRQKVGIPLNAPIRIERFEVDKFEEELTY